MFAALRDGWTLCAGTPGTPIGDAVVPASVPGCVHTDLLAAGLIGDPYVDRNEQALAWIGRSDWTYATEFDWHESDWHESDWHDAAPDASVDLVCQGLDTVATLLLNGQELASTANMHRSYRFDVRRLLQPGRNRLEVRFAAPVPYAQRMSEQLGPLPHVNAHPFNAIRKMACNFGWDWGPDLATAGIWRPIGLDVWRGARLAEVRATAGVDEDGSGRVRLQVRVQRAGGAAAERGGGGLRVSASIAGASAAVDVPPGRDAAELDFAVPDVQLWWPHTHGAQPLYPLHVELSPLAGGEPMDSWRRRVGFRTVRLDTTPDEYGTPFTLEVNGEPVFARGVNWIPDDCFPHRVDRGRYLHRLTQTRDTGVNLVRVWGGGIFESDDFYELADELGMLTWQDFLFACAAYAEAEPLRGEIEAEARQNVVRLMSHPSLVLWNGSNENIWGYAEWGWQEQIGDRPWGLGYYLDLLPRIVAELDPARPYVPSSPYSLAPDRHPNDPAHGTMHIWDVWNGRDYPHYRDYVPRFASEFGFQGPASWATTRRAVHDDPLAADSPGMLAHQKAVDGNEKLSRWVSAHFPEPETFADWHWAASLNQARAVTLAIEHFRSHHGRCMGSVVWQINDCWPVASWAAIDGDGRRKPLWYALRRAYADRLLTLQPRGDGLTAVLVNDAAEPWRLRLSLQRSDFGGTTLGGPAAVHREELVVPPRSVHEVALPQRIADFGDVTAEVVVALAETGGPAGAAPSEAAAPSQAGELRALWFAGRDKELALPPAALSTRVERQPDGYAVVVEAQSLLRDLALLADRADPAAVADDMLVTLFPGETATFRLRTTATLQPGALTGPDVLRCANDLLHPRR